jgi:NIMA (never in mitosis gene a)-related kinase
LNLFLTKSKIVKIGDLGVSKIVSNINALHCSRVGTPLYLSPELIKQIPYDFKVDMWSLGCSLYHLASLDPPFGGDNLITLGNNIVKTKHKQLSSIFSKDLTLLIDRLLNKKAEKRPTSKEAIDMIPKYIIVIVVNIGKV